MTCRSAGQSVAVSTLRPELLPASQAHLQRCQTVTSATLTSDDITTEMSLGYQQNITPVFDKIRGQNASVTAFDTGGRRSRHLLALPRPRQSGARADSRQIVERPDVCPEAVFLKSDILAAPPEPNYQAAIDQLEVLAGSANADTSVKAQVKQAVFLFAEGNKSASKDLISAVINKYHDTLSNQPPPYLMVARAESL